MTDSYPNDESHLLDESHHVFTGGLPNERRPDAARFAALGNLHPDDDHVIKIHGSRDFRPDRGEKETL